MTYISRVNKSILHVFIRNYDLMGWHDFFQICLKIKTDIHSSRFFSAQILIFAMCTAHNV